MNLNTTQNVGDIATQHLAAVRVFEDHGIDYCCGGRRPLEEVCREKGISAEALLAEVNAVETAWADSGRDWASAPLKDLITHIITTHHVYLRDELPAIERRIEAVIRAHAQRHGDVLFPLAKIFAGLKDELMAHMRKEELVLFPFIERTERAVLNGHAWITPPFGTVDKPIHMMEDEHESAGRALQEIRRITNDFTVPDGVCNTYRALLKSLAEMERDLHVHIHLENNILFPRAKQLEAAALA